MSLLLTRYSLSNVKHDYDNNAVKKKKKKETDQCTLLFSSLVLELLTFRLLHAKWLIAVISKKTISKLQLIFYSRQILRFTLLMMAIIG